MIEHAPIERDRMPRDHWLFYAEASDLTLEGHRLIAQEIAYEAGLAWQGLRGWGQALARLIVRPRRHAPPV